MGGRVAPSARGPVRSRTLVLGLSVTQLIGWGTTFYMPTILSGAMSAELALPSSAIFGGVSVMLLIGAMLSPRCGMLMARFGAPRLMVGGSVAAALGLALLSQARGPLTYFVAWALIGVAVPAALTLAACATLAQNGGAHVYRAIAAVTFFVGMTPVAAWPATRALETGIGWRGTCLLYACLHAVICLPIHCLLQRRVEPIGRVASGLEPLADGSAGRTRTARPILLVAIAFALNSFLVTALQVHLIGLLTGVGVAVTAAVLAGSLFGIAQASVRGLELAFGKKSSALTSGLVAFAAMALSIVLLLAGGSAASAVLAFAILGGGAAGLSSLVRATIPLVLYPQDEYPVYLGKLIGLQSFVNALAPVGVGLSLPRAGAAATLSIALAVALISLAMLWFVRSAHLRAAAGERGGRGDTGY
jgi:hypothetical protein